MSIRLVTGEPGAGKSLYVMKQLVDVIRYTDRLIVTNLALRLDPWVGPGGKAQMGLRAYLEREYGDAFNIDQRVRFLDEEECYEFYRHRGRGVSVDCERDAKGNPVSLNWADVVERDLVDVEFVIDEFWKYAGARDWASTGKALFDYGKQHRKVGDNVWLMSHHPKDIDAAVQRIVEETVCMKNHGRMRVGIFRQPGIFTAAHFARVPQGQQQPMNTEHFRLDAEGLCQCYDTSAGVGGLSGGKSADTEHKRKGLPFWLLIGIVIVLALAATQWTRVLGWVLGGEEEGEKRVRMTNAVPAVVSTERTNVDVRLRNGPLAPPRHAVEFEEPVKPVEEGPAAIVGMTAVGETVKIYLSDGRSYRLTDSAVKLVDTEFVVIGEQVFRWGPAVEPVLDAGRRAAVAGPAGNKVVMVDAPREMRRATAFRGFKVAGH